ncbi:DNA-directed RNA polymerase subunit beta [candidate division WOR-3 bacterium]|nr:DNA-directed RNA polymerase subunit beta [candidate division WOR-3 bacterium]
MEFKDFSKLPKYGKALALENIQVGSFEEFLQAEVPSEKRKNVGLEAAFSEAFPVEDIHSHLKLEYLGYEMGGPLYSPDEAIERGATYSKPINGYFRLTRFFEPEGDEGEAAEPKVKDVIEQKVYICDIPYITSGGSFIINGVERVVISQLQRSPGLYFSFEKNIYSTLIVPERGAWFQIDVGSNNVLTAVFERRRKVPLFTFIRSLGFSPEALVDDFVKTDQMGPKPGLVLATTVKTQEGVTLADFGDVLSKELCEFLTERGITKVKVFAEDRYGVRVLIDSIRADKSISEDDALRRIYYKLRSVMPSTMDLARRLVLGMLFDSQRFSLGRVGRHKLNARLGFDKRTDFVLRKDEILAISKRLMEFAERRYPPDDMDHLANRRVKGIGEQLYNVFRQSLLQLAQNSKERASFIDEEKATPLELLNSPVVSNSVTRFFTTGTVSQFMEQVNPLAELIHKRRLTALGPGGLTKDTAGFEVRDVHYSHFGRVCPIETPEGQNIGLITSLAYFSCIDEYGFVKTPYVKVEEGKITDKVSYMNAEEEEEFIIAPLDELDISEDNRIANKEVLARYRGEVVVVSQEKIDYVVFSPKQIFSPSTTLIPFLEHDDGDRALMGSNMQRQAVPLVTSEVPYVMTGVEESIARQAESVVEADESGRVAYVDSRRILLETKTGIREYRLRNFRKSNQYTCIHFRPAVKAGEVVKRGQVLADGPSTYEGHLALGKNILVAFMPLWGYNYEDAVVVSERLIVEDKFTSIQVLEYEIESRETRLGPEEITRDIPGASESDLVELDEFGLVRIGAEVKPDDILVGRITPRGDTELTPEERLLRAIFGEKATNVRDTSLRVEPGVSGTVIGRRILTRNTQDPLARRVIEDRRSGTEKRFNDRRGLLVAQRDSELRKLLSGEKLASAIVDKRGKEIIEKGVILSAEILENLGFDKLRLAKIKVDDKEKTKKLTALLERAASAIVDLEDELKGQLENASRGDDLPHGVLKSIKIYIAQKRNLSVGDKVSGRHGNKGVVSKILPVEDMPYLSDGTPVDIVLNTLGVPSRMNLGQILETTLGYAAHKMGYKAVCPVFDSATISEIKEELKAAGLPSSGKVKLRDGRTGVEFDGEVTVGYMYLMKLVHMVDDKIHARSTGNYSLITQQPLGGKAQFGGQRFGEMEVWALEAYGAAHTLQEMLTIKSDDVEGRNALYESLIKGKNPPPPHMPASFNVLVKELRGLGLNLIPLKEKHES